MIYIIAAAVVLIAYWVWADLVCGENECGGVRETDQQPDIVIYPVFSVDAIDRAAQAVDRTFDEVSWDRVG